MYDLSVVIIQRACSIYLYNTLLGLKRLGMSANHYYIGLILVSIYFSLNQENNHRDQLLTPLIRRVSLDVHKREKVNESKIRPSPMRI